MKLGKKQNRSNEYSGYADRFYDPKETWLFNDVDTSLGAAISGITARIFGLRGHFINNYFCLVAVHLKHFGAKFRTDTIARAEVMVYFGSHDFSSRYWLIDFCLAIA
jgi:hypothetical protein